MSQQDYIKDITRFGLENDKDKLLSTLNEFIEYNKINFALQGQSLLKDSILKHNNKLMKVGFAEARHTNSRGTIDISRSLPEQRANKYRS